jgi:hypothetical protein
MPYALDRAITVAGIFITNDYKLKAGIAQLVWGRDPGWMAGIRFPARISSSLLDNHQTALGPTQPSIQRILWAVTPAVPTT